MVCATELVLEGEPWPETLVAFQVQLLSIAWLGSEVSLLEAFVGGYLVVLVCFAWEAALWARGGSCWPLLRLVAWRTLLVLLGSGTSEVRLVDNCMVFQSVPSRCMYSTLACMS